jgi:hypothetical protein
LIAPTLLVTGVSAELMALPVNVWAAKLIWRRAARDEPRAQWQEQERPASPLLHALKYRQISGKRKLAGVLH